MKLFSIIVLLQISFTSFSQREQLIGNIKKQDKPLEYQYLTVLLKQDDSTIQAKIPDSNGHFVLKNIAAGIYTLVIKQIGFRDNVSDSIKVIKGKTNECNIIYPGPCKFLYSKKQKPKCIGGHSDSIILIVYGDPTKKTLEKSSKGLIYLGGCIVTDCDPHYYCKIHKRQL